MLTPGNAFVRILEPSTLDYQYWRFRTGEIAAQPFDFPHGKVEAFAFAGNRPDAWHDLPLPHPGTIDDLCVTQAGNVFCSAGTSVFEHQIYLLRSGERWERVTPPMPPLNGMPPLALTAGAHGDVWLVARCVPQGRITAHLYHASA
jgi:hypothetical protein